MVQKRSIERTWLIQLRGSRSQADIAQSCGTSQQYYCSIELGTRRPSIRLAKTIGKALGFDWTLFYEDDNNSSQGQQSFTS